jgi:membrane associated rhomboid family serine protease
MSVDSSYKDYMKKNRNAFLAILMIPVLGMVVAIPLIIWKAPSTMMVALGVIFVLIVQYSLLVRWISKRIDQMTES